MIRKYQDNYNPKIDFKMIYFLNPKLDSMKNYYEIVDIYFKSASYVSEQGKWFEKVKKLFFLILESKEINLEILTSCANILEADINETNVSLIFEKINLVKKKNRLYQATWFLNEIINHPPISKYSEIIAILIFNSILKKSGYIPIIFLNSNIEFLKGMIESKITISSLIDFFFLYEDLSMKYEKKYPPLKKDEVITIIKAHQKTLTKKYLIKKIWLYGSFVRNEENDYSDIDLFIDFYQKLEEDQLLEVKKYLEMLFMRNVDMTLECNVKKDTITNGLIEREVILDDCKPTR